MRPSQTLAPTRSSKAPILAACAVALLGITSSAAATAQTPGERAAMDRKRQVAEVEARQEIEALFSRLCPGRCELIEVRAIVSEPKPIGEVTPGFGGAGAAAFDAELKRIEARVMLDSKLPRTFLTNIPAMLRYRLSAITPNVIITPNILEFPSPQNPPMPPLIAEPPRRAPEPQPMPELPKAKEEPKEQPKPAPVAKEAPKEDEAKAKPSWARELWRELLPWIPVALMLIMFFALFLVMLRRMKELLEARPVAPLVADTGADDAAAGNMPDTDALRQQLRQSRSVQNEVLRRWLTEDPEAVALLVRMLGPEILGDLKQDRALRPALEEVSASIARQDGPLEPREAQRVAQEARSRIMAARVLHEDQGLSSEWEFVQGLTIGNLQRMTSTLSPQERSYAIGQLPTALRASYLDQMSAEERRELFLNAGAGDSLSREEAIDLATRMRKGAEEVAHIGGEANGQAAIIVEMLGALALTEREDTLRELRARRPEVAAAVLAQVFLETAIPLAPREAVADAMYRTPLDELVRFMRGTREDVRAFLTDAAPGNVRGPLAEELDLEIPVSRADYMAARDAFTDTLAGMLRREGQDLGALNAQALHGARPSTHDEVA